MKTNIIRLDIAHAEDMILNHPSAFPYLTIEHQDFINLKAECNRHIAFETETCIDNLFETVSAMLHSLTSYLEKSSHGILVIQGDSSSIRASPQETPKIPDAIDNMKSFIWGWQQTLETTSEPNPPLNILLILGSYNNHY